MDKTITSIEGQSEPLGLPAQLTLRALLRRRSEDCSARVLYTYLIDGEREEVHLTGRELESKALDIACMLRSFANPGDRVILLCPPGIEFVTAFYGTICAGMIAVPAYPPHNEQTLTRLETIATDAGAELALCTVSVMEKMGRRSGLNLRLAGLRCLAIEETPQHSTSAWCEPELDESSIALIQYTSGSTGTPKGAMVSHGNLFHNASLIRSCFGYSPYSCGVIWLPPYHDMGLIGGVFYPLFVGGRAILMSPFHFLQKPVRWLDAISRHRATISGGPNFAYDLCVRRISPDQLAGLDLSCWDVAFNGAEPVRADTIHRFSAAFEPCGFDRRSFLTCYGLAEATLLVTGRTKKAEPTILRLNAQALQSDRPLSIPCGNTNGCTLVGCGSPVADQRMLIVDPEKRTAVMAGEIGEIWVSGPSVTQGYWEKPEETLQEFKAELAVSGEGPFLRTGDLGFLHNNELFVTGRLKDLIIIRGLNHYPQDIELTVEKSHAALRTGCGAAFSIDADGEERLVVVQEVERAFLRDLDSRSVFRAIREAVSEVHELQVNEVVLIKTFSIPKTPSGKVQRHLCRSGFLDGSLNVVARSADVRDKPEDMLQSNESDICWPELIKKETPAHVLPLLESHIRRIAAKIVRTSPGEIDPGRPLKALGIDSLMAVELKLRIESDTGGEIPMEAVFQGASVSDLAAHVLWRLAGRESDVAVSPPAEVAVRSFYGRNDEQEPCRPKHCPEIHSGCFRCEDFPEVLNLQRILKEMENHDIANPYFRNYQQVSKNTARLGDREFITFSNYNYLNLSGHPLVVQAAKEAIDHYGTSVSASRVASGERPLHRELERELANLVGTDDCIAYVSGHATNVTTIGHLFGKDDLVLHDSLIHNSVLQGCLLSGAARCEFPHNDWQVLDKLLDERRSRHRKVLIVIEGLYSMDGDIPDLAEFVRIRKRHKALLMVDEAHSIGVLGETGRGIGEHFSVDPSDVDLWMGTLSKSLASCGGYVAGCSALIQYLKYTAPGFVYSVGLTPADTAAALAAIRILRAEPQRVRKLRSQAKTFWNMVRERGLDTGTSNGLPIVPVIVGDSLKAVRLSQALLERNVDVLPMVYPAVPDRAARLRFFVSCGHTIEQFSYALDALSSSLAV